MICRRCATAADAEVLYQKTTGKPSGLKGTHCTDPTCACQHKPIKVKESVK